MSLATHPIAQRIGDWIAGRRGTEAGTVALDQRRVYIVPTRAGLVFGLAVLALLIGSINYNLQLGFVLCFLVASMALVGMHATHRNLAGIRLRGVRAEPAFAGENAHFQIEVSSAVAFSRHAISLAFVPRAAARAPARALPAVSIDLAPQAGLAIDVPLATRERGRLPAPRLTLETHFPFGLWRAWAYLQPALTAVVYPRPEADPPPLPAALGGTAAGHSVAASGDDFAGIRPYRPGDPQKTIAWRLAARTNELAVKLFDDAGGGELMLDWAQLPRQLSVEQRLSRLTRWVLDADAAHLSYGLALPGQIVVVERGAAQLERCLTALALFRD